MILKKTRKNEKKNKKFEKSFLDIEYVLTMVHGMKQLKHGWI